MEDCSKYLIIEFDLEVTECPCGSGKNPVKCCGHVKPRTHTALLDRRNYEESDGIAIGLDYSLKRVVDEGLLPIIGEATITQGHFRDGKCPKIIFRGEADTEYVMKPDASLRNYDAIYVIDTNTRKYSDHEVSMSAVMHAYKANEGIKCIPLTVLEFWDAEISPEILGWYALLGAIENQKELSGKRIGIIVDSSLGDIDKYNNREKPLCKECYIPENVYLIYASSDKKDSIANKLISICDKLSTKQLDILESKDIGVPPSSTYPCKYFRQWTH